jgi:LacI family transcriptional regulator
VSGNGHRPTVAEVARLAGVSQATVSRTLNGIRDVDPELQTRVLDAAAELGYRVNLLGRALRQRRTATAGLLVPDLENPFFSGLAQHLARAFAAPGIDLMVASADSSLETEERGVRSFVGRQVDALVVIPVHEVDSGPNIHLATSAVATVQLDRRVPGTAAHFVGVDNRRGMRLVHEHLATLDLDRQPVVYVGARPESSSAHERLDAFTRLYGTDAPVLLGSFDLAWGQAAAERLVESGWRAATVVTAADVIAVGLMHRLQSLGHRVPEDFRVIGFDGIGVATRLANPDLTTVRQPVERIAQAVRTLVESGSNTATPVLRRLRPTLTVGRSSPASAGPTG